MQGSRKEEGAGLGAGRGIDSDHLTPQATDPQTLTPSPTHPTHLPQRPNCLTAKQKRQNFWAKWLICRGVGVRNPFWFSFRVVCIL